MGRVGLAFSMYTKMPPGRRCFWISYSKSKAVLVRPRGPQESCAGDEGSRGRNGIGGADVVEAPSVVPDVSIVGEVRVILYSGLIHGVEQALGSSRNPAASVQESGMSYGRGAD